METIGSAITSDVPAVQGGVAVQDAVVVEGGVVVLPQWFDPRRAVHEHDIMCLVCGKSFRQLTNTHLRTHDLTTASYKIRFGYNRCRPLMSQVLLRMYTARAIQTSLASRIRCRPIVSNPELRRLGGHRPIALEEVLARRDARLRRREELPSRRGAASSPRPRARRDAGPAEPPQAGDRDLEANRSPVVDSTLMSATAPGSPQSGAHASRAESTARADRSQSLAEYRLLVNGCARTCAVEPETPLLRVLREGLGLMGAEYGAEYRCGTARCGACTVLLDDVVIRSCVTPVRHATGEITTIEGLRHSDALVVVQEAWVAEKVPQCGYCRSGQIMAAVALLGHREDPDDADIVLAMAGRLCRHDAYPQIRKAIKRAAAARKAARSPGPGAPRQPDSPPS